MLWSWASWMLRLRYDICTSQANINLKLLTFIYNFAGNKNNNGTVILKCDVDFKQNNRLICQLKVKYIGLADWLVRVQSPCLVNILTLTSSTHQSHSLSRPTPRLKWNAFLSEPCVLCSALQGTPQYSLQYNWPETILLELLLGNCSIFFTVQLATNNLTHRTSLERDSSNKACSYRS